jgi:hypothetical protein
MKLDISEWPAESATHATSFIARPEAESDNVALAEFLTTSFRYTFSVSDKFYTIFLMLTLSLRTRVTAAVLIYLPLWHP